MVLNLLFFENSSLDISICACGLYRYASTTFTDFAHGMSVFGLVGCTHECDTVFLVELHNRIKYFMFMCTHTFDVV